MFLCILLLQTDGWMFLHKGEHLNKQHFDIIPLQVFYLSVCVFEGWGILKLQHAETALDGNGCRRREVEALRNDLDAVRSLKVDLCGICIRITTENRKINQVFVVSIISAVQWN